MNSDLRGEAARVLGLHRYNLYRKMRQLGMDVDESAGWLVSESSKGVMSGGEWASS